jgi:protein-S-isoprenylcysteine O-methyltransferase Ste14
VRSEVLLAIAVLLALGALALIRQGTRQETLLVGGLLVLIGLPLVALARRQLGRAFTLTPQAKGLVMQGLYARIPHPMYVFLDVTLLGAIIILRQGWPLVLWAGLVCVQAWQARRETMVLEQAFGDAHREYRKLTWW